MAMYLVAGTQSANGKQNFVNVMKMSELQEMEEERSTHVYQFSLLHLLCLNQVQWGEFGGDEKDRGEWWG